jgi:hypothetical protein
VALAEPHSSAELEQDYKTFQNRIVRVVETAPHATHERPTEVDDLDLATANRWASITAVELQSR